MEQAPATSPARPVSIMVRSAAAAPATPITRLRLETSPSLAPSTAARSALPLPLLAPVWCSLSKTPGVSPAIGGLDGALIPRDCQTPRGTERRHSGLDTPRP